MSISEDSKCRWCLYGTPAVIAYSAKARWIVENPRDGIVSTLLHCPECDLVYFGEGFTEEELLTMYSGYRETEYFQRRHRFEPWYTKRVNDAIGHSSSVLQLRREHLRNFVERVGDNSRIRLPRKVLDVGGDEGQFIPDLPSIESRAVLEVSGIRPVDDVTSLLSWDDAAHFEPDMMMMCHVLEHTADARTMIESASKILQKGQLLYLEVPLDRPRKIGKVFKSRTYRSYTSWLATHPVMFGIADLIGLVTRRFLGRPFIGSVIKQNEHLNFFNRQSLLSVVESFGFLEIGSSTYSPSSGVPILNVEAIGMLFIKG